jgi:ubiquinone/menaquinone biosynthesis C-methylase UbiE
MNLEWTKDYFDELYLKYFLLTQDDKLTKNQVGFVEKFIKPGDKILDAGCGIGRHSILLAKDSFNVTGIDTSQVFLEEARKYAIIEGTKNCQFINLDMRELEFEGEFNGIINLWSSFGYFEDETNFNILKRFYASLTANGIIIIDIENRDYILKNFVYETFKEGDEIFILERRKFNPINSVISTHRYYIGKDFRKEYMRHIRIYSATEMINLFREAGLKEIKLFGDYSGEEFHVSSKRIIISGKKVV